MAVATWEIDPARSSVSVRAKTTLHAAHSHGEGLTGRLRGDPDHLEGTSGGEVRVPLRQHGFGNALQDAAMRRSLDVDRWPEVRYVVTGVDVLSRDPWHVRVHGEIHWRDRVTPLTAEATGTLDDAGLDARATFPLSLPALGVTPPRLLFLKVADDVEVDVRLVAARVE